MLVKNYIDILITYDFLLLKKTYLIALIKESEIPEVKEAIVNKE